jgi:Transposase, Mutator family
VHALRNVTKKLPERLHRELKARYWRMLDEASSLAEARASLLALAGDFRAAYPPAAAVIERDVDALVRHLRFPAAHRKRIRSTDEKVKGRAAWKGRISTDRLVAARARRARRSPPVGSDLAGLSRRRLFRAFAGTITRATTADRVG